MANTYGRTLNKKIISRILAISPQMFAHKWELRQGKYELILDVPNDDKKNGRLFKDSCLTEDEIYKRKATVKKDMLAIVYKWFYLQNNPFPTNFNDE
jgi:hypothetical protein